MISSSDGKLLAIYNKNDLQTHIYSAGEQQDFIEIGLFSSPEPNRITSHFSPNNEFIFIHGDKKGVENGIVYDVQRKKIVYNSNYSDVGFSGGGNFSNNLFAVSYDRNVYIYDERGKYILFVM